MGRGRRKKILSVLLSSGLLLASMTGGEDAWAASPVLSQSETAAAAQTEAALPVPSEGSVLEVAQGRIEQVYVNLPEAVMYGSGINTDELSGAEAYLAQEKLSLVKTGTFAELEEGICYYVLLDISGSIPDRYFAKVKEGIQNLQNSLGEKDKLILCAFGEEVTLAADGNQTPESMAGILAGLDNNDQKTLLFEGIDRAAALASGTEGEECRRKVLAVISDGEDIAVGKKMAAEAQETLKETGLPAYAFCIRDTATVNINSFGEFARTSGGDMITFQPDEGAQILTDLAARLHQDVYAEYKADTNIVTNQEETFSLRLADGRVLTRDVMNVYWIPDEEAPYLLSGTMAGDRQIKLTFSEAVTGLEAAANYQVSFGGEPVGVTGVAYDKEDETSVVLTLAEPLANGNYEIRCSNIVDVSMEKNPIEGSLDMAVTEIPEPEEVVEEESADYTGVLFLVFAAVAALAVVLAVKFGKKKPEEKAKEIPEGGDHSVVALNSADSRQHISMDSRTPVIIQAVILVKGKNPAKTRWELNRSLIVGRASICDIFFDDAQMSRQHFCLEREGDSILISDLESTNGTSVNGIAIKKRRQLKPGDTIEAGSVKITVRW